jgi:medium-chain acyl-[acyl-carrier-protein] hydrolase
MPSEVLRNEELMQLTLPILRSDFRLLETHHFVAEDPVPVPISVFCGLGDTEVSPADVLAWSTLTCKVFRSRFLEGDHFFLLRSAAKVVGFVHEDLTASSAAPVGLGTAFLAAERTSHVERD